MPLIKTELLIPRVLCIGTKEGEPNDTSRDYISGNIITVGDYLSNSDFLSMKATAEYLGGLVEKFPHLFKPLPWWEKRSPLDMPDYIKNKTAIPVTFSKVDEWDADDNGKIAFCVNGRWSGNLWAIEPADLSDWEEYQKQKQ